MTDTNIKVSRVLIIGATSAIAKEVARMYAAQGSSICLVGRNISLLGSLQDDLLVRGARSADHIQLDVNEYDNHAEAISSAVSKLGSIDIAIICHGTLPDQPLCVGDASKTLEEISTNGISTVLLLTHLGEVMGGQQRGTIAVVTSVAGDRGRRSNYVYGASKALVSTFLEGFRGEMLGKGVHIVDIRPGFVDTPMTSHIERKGILWSSPEKIANIIVSAVNKRKHTVYAPFYWQFIMLIVRLIPTPIFKKLNF